MPKKYPLFFETLNFSQMTSCTIICYVKMWSLLVGVVKNWWCNAEWMNKNFNAPCYYYVIPLKTKQFNAHVQVSVINILFGRNYPHSGAFFSQHRIIRGKPKCLDCWLKNGDFQIPKKYFQNFLLTSTGMWMCVDSLNFQALVILDIRDCCFHQGSSRSNALCDDGGRLYSRACALYHHPAAC